MAGVSGLEPERSVLETLILPLYYTPNQNQQYNDNINNKRILALFLSFKDEKDLFN